MAGRSTVGSSYKQCSKEKSRDRHDAGEGEILEGADGVAALKEDELVWATQIVYL
jgi:hypothetical protein